MGRPKDPNKKVQVSVRLAPDIRDRADEAVGEGKAANLSALIGDALDVHLKKIESRSS